MEKPWFRAKRYGWGWYPATWQGWLVLLLYIAAVVLNILRLKAQAHYASEMLPALVAETIAMAVVLGVVCYLTGERPRWRWGGENSGQDRN